MLPRNSIFSWQCKQFIYDRIVLLWDQQKYDQIMIYMKGYECTKILIDILLRRLKGLRRYKAGAALKRKMTFPLFITIKV